MKYSKRLQKLALIFVCVAVRLSAGQGDFLPVWKGSNGTPLGYYEYLPQGYDDHPSSNYPVVFFWHGLSQSGNGTTELGRVQKYGLAKNLSNGAQYPAIIICAQTLPWTNVTNLHHFANYIRTNQARPYRIDLRYQYMTGLSMGGGYTWKYAREYPTELAAIVTVCGAAGTNPGDLSALSGLKIRAYHNLMDPTVPVSETFAWVNAVKAGNGKVALSLYAKDVHDAWAEAYSEPDLYDWLWAQPSPNQAPAVDAGNNFIFINQSNSVVSLSGTASDDGVPSTLKTSWKRRAGPSRVTFANSNALVTTMSVETTNQNIVTNRIRLNAEDGQFKTLDEIFLVYTPPSDTTAPVVTASHYNRTTNEAFTLNLYTTEDNGYYSVNGGAFVSFAAPMTSLVIASTTTVLFYGRDSFGNTSVTNQRVYTFDTTAPVVDVSAPSLTTNQVFTVLLTTTDRDGYFSTNSSAFVSFGPAGTNVVISGTTALAYYGRDALGNTSATNQRIYTFDTNAPVVTASHFNRTTNQTFTLNLYTTEDNGYYSVDGGAFVVFAAPKASLTIASTTTVRYYGRDSLGNTSSTNQRVYTFDTNAPVLGVSVNSLTTNQVFAVALSTTENSGYFSTNGSAFAPYTTVGTNLVISETTALLFYGRDALGNTSATNTRTYTVIWGDITPPTVDASLPSLVTNEVFNVALTTTEDFGYFSTNGSSYFAFTTAGTNLIIRETTTLSFYGRDTNGNTSATNSRFYSMPALVYENAESGLTNGWVIYDNDPVGSTVTNVFDAQKNSRVIQVSGSGLINGYRRYLSDGKSYWRDRVRPVVGWSMKYSENFIVYIDVVTTAGNKYITYDASTNEKWLGTNTTGATNYVFHGLGTGAKNGVWQTFTRDLAADLADLLPLESLVEVNGFMIRGSGSVDDISLQERSGSAGVATLSMAPSFQERSGDARPAALSTAPGNIPTVFVSNNGGLWTHIHDEDSQVSRSLSLQNLTAAVDPVEESIRLFFDLKKEGPGAVELRMDWVVSGEKKFASVPAKDLSGETLIYSNGAWALKWFIPKSMDRAKKIDVRLSGSLPGSSGSEVVAREIDLGQLFGVQKSLDRAVALNNPWCGQSEGIDFVNLTEGARVEIYSASGRLMATLPGDPSGKRVWNLRDKSGHLAAPGIYNGVIISGGERRSIKIMILP